MAASADFHWSITGKVPKLLKKYLKSKAGPSHLAGMKQIIRSALLETEKVLTKHVLLDLSLVLLMTGILKNQAAQEVVLP